jgi:hypothetical protein
MKLTRKLLFLVDLYAAPILTAAQASVPQIPAEVKMFVEKGQHGNHARNGGFERRRNAGFHSRHGKNKTSADR